jgi:hypothetical protein
MPIGRTGGAVLRLHEADRASEAPMLKLNAAIGAGAVAALLFLAGCNGPPWTLEKSPTGIALRWYPDTTPALLADEVAELHCGSSDKAAELVSDTRDGSAEIAKYYCR